MDWIEKLLNGIKGNWKTTLLGVLAAVGIISGQLINLLDGKPETLFDWNTFWMAGIMALIGLFAKDGDKSSKALHIE